MPVVHGLVPGEAVVRDVVGEEVEQPLRAQLRVVLDVVLLGRDHRKVLLLLASKKWVVKDEFDADHGNSTNGSGRKI